MLRESSKQPRLLERATAIRWSGYSRTSLPSPLENGSNRLRHSRAEGFSRLARGSACGELSVLLVALRGGGVLLLDTSTLIDLEQELTELWVGPVRTFLGRNKAQALACATVSVGELASG